MKGPMPNMPIMMINHSKDMSFQDLFIYRLAPSAQKHSHEIRILYLYTVERMETALAPLLIDAPF